MLGGLRVVLAPFLEPKLELKTDTWPPVIFRFVGLSILWSVNRPQERPKTVQDPLRALQERPKTTQDAPKTPQDAQNNAQDDQN